MQSLLIHYPEPNRRPVVPERIASDLPGLLLRPIALSDFRPLGPWAPSRRWCSASFGSARGTINVGALLTDDDDPARIAALRDRLDRVFTTTADDRRLRRAMETVHLGSRTSEEDCLAALNVSRRTWFRLLRAARERVVAGG